MAPHQRPAAPEAIRQRPLRHKHATKQTCKCGRTRPVVVGSKASDVKNAQSKPCTLPLRKSDHLLATLRRMCLANAFAASFGSFASYRLM
jgi:hypothetical protein